MPVRSASTIRLTALLFLLAGWVNLHAQQRYESPVRSECDCDGETECDSERDEECEPLLKFLDDLYCFPFGTCRRDPYEERIETERHDFTQSTKTVGRGVLQFEGGYSYFYKDTDEEIEHSHTTPEALLRLGLSDDIEVRAKWTYGWRFITEDENLDSAQDLIWSLKLGMTEECGWIPESALEFRSSVPTGGAEWSLGRVEAGFDYIFSWELAEGWELYGSFGYLGTALGDFSLLPEEPAGENFDVWSYSVALGIELSRSSTLYLEWFGLASRALEDDFSLSFFNAGIDFYLSDNLILDLRAGKGLTDDSDDFFGGIGGGVRF